MTQILKQEIPIIQVQVEAEGTKDQETLENIWIHAAILHLLHVW